MKNPTKINSNVLKANGHFCSKAPYNGIIFNSAQMMIDAGLDNLSLKWPKAVDGQKEEKDLGFDLNFYLSISG